MPGRTIEVYCAVLCISSRPPQNPSHYVWSAMSCNSKVLPLSVRLTVLCSKHDVLNVHCAAELATCAVS